MTTHKQNRCHEQLLRRRIGVKGDLDYYHKDDRYCKEVRERTAKSKKKTKKREERRDFGEWRKGKSKKGHGIRKFRKDRNADKEAEWVEGIQKAKTRAEEARHEYLYAADEDKPALRLLIETLEEQETTLQRKLARLRERERRARDQ